MIPRLFGLAVALLLVAVGLAAASGGWPVLTAYLVVVATLLGLAGRTAWKSRARSRHAGRTCTCCTTTVFDQVEVR